jgi:hypothetical protein
MTRPDGDTLQYGTNPPFEHWESDLTALVNVLWSAAHQGLTLDHADEIAHMILGSRWMAAREHQAADAARAAVLQLVADQPGIPDYAHEGLLREIGADG